MKWWISAEKERERLQSELDQAKTQEERNKLGQFATPFTLARQIIDVAQAYQALTPQQVRFLEPALGTGAFYSAFLAETGGSSPGRAVGVEIDETVAQSVQRLWSGAGLSVCTADFLALSPAVREDEKFNLLVTNPPYVRHHHLSATNKKKLIQLVTESLDFRPNGLMGLYGYFLLLAHRWLQREAIAAWLIPVEFMDVGYGIALKRYLSERVELLRVHRFDADDAQFDGVYVTSAV